MCRTVTAFDLAQRFVGLTEVAGAVDNPQIMAMLKLDMDWPDADEVPWCSSFPNYIAWLLRLPRSKSLMARSWLTVGRPVAVEIAECAYDIVILKRFGANEPGPEVINAKGHVGFFAGYEPSGTIYVLGGNQSNSVNIASYPIERLLGIRRIG